MSARSRARAARSLWPGWVALWDEQEPPTLLASIRIALAAVVLVAVAGKLAGSAAAARLTGMSWREAGAIGTLMNTRGLMELVILNIGLDIGVISPAVFAMMVLMALATTVMTSPLLELIYPPRLIRHAHADDEAPL